MTKQLTGRALDYAVAKAEGWVDFPTDSGGAANYWYFDANKAPHCGYVHKDDWWPSKGAEGDAIIDREMISTQVYDASFKPEVMWNAYMPGDMPFDKDEEINGPDRRTAAMRCWVMHKLGHEVEVPDELVVP